MNKEEKIYFSISEIARIVKIKPHVLRYWETEFSNLKPEKSEAGQRRYRQKDLELIQTIKNLLHDKKYTISGAKEVLKKYPVVCNIKENTINANWVKQELNEMLHMLES
ncbi:MAG: MerR family transcriptional regulator [bacterium]|nr:MerR family transcriptional regulator [bacterium]